MGKFDELVKHETEMLEAFGIDNMLNRYYTVTNSDYIDPRLPKFQQDLIKIKRGDLTPLNGYQKFKIGYTYMLVHYEDHNHLILQEKVRQARENIRNRPAHNTLYPILLRLDHHMNTANEDGNDKYEKQKAFWDMCIDNKIRRDIKDRKLYCSMNSLYNESSNVGAEADRYMASNDLIGGFLMEKGTPDVPNVFYCKADEGIKLDDIKNIIIEDKKRYEANIKFLINKAMCDTAGTPVFPKIIKDLIFAIKGGSTTGSTSSGSTGGLEALLVGGGVGTTTSSTTSSIANREEKFRETMQYYIENVVKENTIQTAYLSALVRKGYSICLRCLESMDASFTNGNIEEGLGMPFYPEIEELTNEGVANSIINDFMQKTVRNGDPSFMEDSYFIPEHDKVVEIANAVNHVLTYKLAHDATKWGRKLVGNTIGKAFNNITHYSQNLLSQNPQK